jgi:hypothetical protein
LARPVCDLRVEDRQRLTDFVLVFVLVLETSPGESDYENENEDDDDPAWFFPALSFNCLRRTLERPCHGRDTNGLPLM